MLKLTFRNKIVEQLAFVGKNACFGQKNRIFVQNKPESRLKSNKIGLISTDF